MRDTFKEVQNKKQFLLNKTNFLSIEEIAGNDDADEWIGQRMVIYPTTCDYKGDRVATIRIRSIKADRLLKAMEEEKTTPRRQANMEAEPAKTSAVELNDEIPWN
jgi:hypothetical protein